MFRGRCRRGSQAGREGRQSHPQTAKSHVSQLQKIVKRRVQSKRKAGEGGQSVEDDGASLLAHWLVIMIAGVFRGSLPSPGWLQGFFGIFVAIGTYGLRGRGSDRLGFSYLDIRLLRRRGHG